MPSLAELQATLARATVRGAAADLPEALHGGRDPRARFGVHVRHYRSSLSAALADKFPATVWLLGRPSFLSAASAFVHSHPPRTACIAEYGCEFPDFLARFPSTIGIDVLGPLTQLEWLVARAAISVDEPAMTWLEVTEAGPDALLDARLELKPGTGYLRASHEVDSVLSAFLAELDIACLEIVAGETLLEVSGARGAFRITRLDAASFEFRNALWRGSRISAAASAALDSGADFDAGTALRQLVGADLVVGLARQERAHR